MELIPAEMTKYGLGFDFADPIPSMLALVTKIWEIQAQIESAKTSTVATDKVATHPFDVKASKDKAAGKIAADLIKAFVAACDVAIGKNANVAWHLAQTDSTITQYLTSEMQYYRVKTAPKVAPTSGSKLDELRSDRKVLVNQARNFLDTFTPLAAAIATDERFKKDDDGKLALPNLQGAGGKTSDTPSGRYAKYMQTSWTIDGTSFPVGTDPRDLVRAIWSGTERVGKKVTDVFGPIDEARKKAKPGDVVSVTINGKVVTYQEVKS